MNCEGCGAPQTGHPMQNRRDTCEYCGRLSRTTLVISEMARPASLDLQYQALVARQYPHEQRGSLFNGLFGGAF